MNKKALKNIKLANSHRAQYEHHIAKRLERKRTFKFRKRRLELKELTGLVNKLKRAAIGKND